MKLHCHKNGPIFLINLIKDVKEIDPLPKHVRPNKEECQ